MKQFKEQSGVNLIITGTDLDSEATRIFTAHSSPDLPLKYACRISAGFPFYFPPIYWLKSWGKYLGQSIEGHKLVDGGVLFNLPTALLVSSDYFQNKYYGEVISSVEVLSFSLDAGKKEDD